METWHPSNDQADNLLEIREACLVLNQLYEQYSCHREQPSLKTKEAKEITKDIETEMRERLEGLQNLVLKAQYLGIPDEKAFYVVWQYLHTDLLTDMVELAN